VVVVVVVVVVMVVVVVVVGGGGGGRVVVVVVVIGVDVGVLAVVVVVVVVSVVEGGQIVYSGPKPHVLNTTNQRDAAAEAHTFGILLFFTVGEQSPPAVFKYSISKTGFEAEMMGA
jgi:hypothetical protein